MKPREWGKTLGWLAAVKVIVALAILAVLWMALRGLKGG